MLQIIFHPCFKLENPWHFPLSPLPCLEYSTLKKLPVQICFSTFPPPPFSGTFSFGAIHTHTKMGFFQRQNQLKWRFHTLRKFGYVVCVYISRADTQPHRVRQCFLSFFYVGKYFNSISQPSPHPSPWIVSLWRLLASIFFCWPNS